MKLCAEEVLREIPLFVVEFWMQLQTCPSVQGDFWGRIMSKMHSSGNSRFVTPNSDTIPGINNSQ